MIRVRWSQRCVACPRWLPAGTRAYRYHRRIWCGPCALAHRLRCSTHAVPVQEPETELVLF